MVVATLEVKIPRLPRGTHPAARRWYRSLRESSQARFFEPSDWAAAAYVAEMMTRLLNAPVITDEEFAAVWGAMGDVQPHAGGFDRVPESGGAA